VAIDDAGAGYSGLRQVIELRPDFVKLDRSLVDGIDRDEVKRALAELLGAFASRIDAWLLAEGVEYDGELATIVQLGIPLAQGWLLGRGGPEMTPLNDGVAERIRSLASVNVVTDHVAALVEAVASCPADEPAAVAEAFEADGRADLVVAVDVRGRPSGWLDRATWLTGRSWAPGTLTVAPASVPGEVLRRAMAARDPRCPAALHRQDRAPARRDPDGAPDRAARLSGAAQAPRPWMPMNGAAVAKREE
jgi:EAL domain-containing protein